MSMAQQQLLYELWHKVGLLKGTKTPESSKAFLDAIEATFEAKTENISNESLFPDKKPKINNRNNPALDKKRNGTR